MFIHENTSYQKVNCYTFEQTSSYSFCLIKSFVLLFPLINVVSKQYYKEILFKQGFVTEQDRLSLLGLPFYLVAIKAQNTYLIRFSFYVFIVNQLKTRFHCCDKIYQKIMLPSQLKQEKEQFIYWYAQCAFQI